jgi:hypothetical protein
MRQPIADDGKAPNKTDRAEYQVPQVVRARAPSPRGLSSPFLARALIDVVVVLVMAATAETRWGIIILIEIIIIIVVATSPTWPGQFLRLEFNDLEFNDIVIRRCGDFEGLLALRATHGLAGHAVGNSKLLTAMWTFARFVPARHGDGPPIDCFLGDTTRHRGSGNNSRNFRIAIAVGSWAALLSLPHP